MKSHVKRLQYLLETMDVLDDVEYPKRKLLLTLLYWKVFDGIDIPDSVMQSILQQGTNPETIFRALRKAQAKKRDYMKKEDLNHVNNRCSETEV